MFLVIPLTILSQVKTWLGTEAELTDVGNRGVILSMYMLGAYYKQRQVSLTGCPGISSFNSLSKSTNIALTKANQ